VIVNEPNENIDLVNYGANVCFFLYVLLTNDFALLGEQSFLSVSTNYTMFYLLMIRDLLLSVSSLIFIPLNVFCLTNIALGGEFSDFFYWTLTTFFFGLLLKLGIDFLVFGSLFEKSSTFMLD